MQEVTQLATDICEVIYQEELSVAEVVCLLALVQARIMSRIYASDVPKPAPATPPAPVKATPKVMPKKAVKYDPMYDPPPPMDSDPLPPPVTSNRIIAQKNQACICDHCRKVIYVVNKDIPDSCKIPDFVASFTPSEGIDPLPKTTEVLNIDGKISCDCPACGGVKSLYLTGVR